MKILPWCDPDGVAHGGVRFNRNGYDLNRNWDIVDPVKMPEITAERHAIFDWLEAGKPVDFFLTLHNTETNEYLHGPPDSSEALRPVLERVNEYWSQGKTFAAAHPAAFLTRDNNGGEARPDECRAGVVSRSENTSFRGRDENCKAPEAWPSSEHRRSQTCGC